MGKSMCAINEIGRSYMPDDLALCVLSKMPVKSLKRFGCLRKSWASLFENPHFMSIYRNNFISNHQSYYDDTSVFLQTSVDDFYSLNGETYENIVKLDWPNPFEEENPSFWILHSGSITGILCLYYHGLAKRVVLWNPATNDFKVLPPSPLVLVPPYQHFKAYLHGFGYDHVRDDYNIIRTITYFCPTSFDLDKLGMSYEDVPREYISEDTLLEMYSLRSNSWRKLDADDSVIEELTIARSTDEQLFIDGIFHWWFFNYNDPPHYDEKTLMSFDLVHEVFYKTPIPLDISRLPGQDGWKYMVAINRSTGLISWYDRSTAFDILILGELGVKESWTKLLTIGPLPCVERPIGIGKKCEIFFRKNGELVLFDLGSQKIEELGVEANQYSHILIYRENLLPMG